MTNLKMLSVIKSELSERVTFTCILKKILLLYAKSSDVVVKSNRTPSVTYVHSVSFLRIKCIE